MKPPSLLAGLIVALVAQIPCQAAEDPADAVIQIDAASPSIRLSDTMWGLFFEEINFAGDGGIYAELVRQRDFEGEDPLQSWSLVRHGAGKRARHVQLVLRWLRFAQRQARLLRHRQRPARPNGWQTEHRRLRLA